MAKKRRRKTRSTPRKRSDGRFGAMLFGLVAGLGIAAAAWWLLAPASPRQLEAGGSTAPTAATPTETPVRDEPTARPVEIEATGVGYDFYDMLPAQEIVVSDDFRERREGARTAAPPAKLTEPGQYLIQAGSFRNIEGAERIEALLALQGIRARVEPIDTAQGRLHQVRVGPLDVATVNAYRDRLAAAEIDVVVLRVAP